MFWTVADYKRLGVLAYRLFMCGREKLFVVEIKLGWSQLIDVSTTHN